MKVLVTGGAGYIGSHTCIELIQAGHDIVVVDNLANSKREALGRVETICGTQIPFYCVDVTDRAALEAVFIQEAPIDAVIHFAGLKAVGESWEKPGDYYRVNVYGSLVLAEVMEAHGVTLLAFSSSATVYGDPHTVPIREDFPVGATNPYGRSKLMVEEIYQDLSNRKGNTLRIALLRYFNPIGAHESGTIGEDPKGIPNNLLPYVAQVAVGTLPCLRVFGNDYPTVDGTGIRDYIHVVDLARGHLAALSQLEQEAPGAFIWNLGTGCGYSVLQVVEAFAKACGREIPYEIVPRRPGDIAQCYADPKLAADKLNWTAQHDLTRMVTDAWRWQSNNPTGY